MTRRAISKKHIEGKFKASGNLSLYYQYWSPDGEPKAVLLVAHGLAEHSGRYLNLVNYFVPRGYTVCSFDYQGHGKSEGLRGYVEQFSYYLDDFKSFFDMVRGMYPDAKIFIIGHSMGGTIATTYALHHQDEFDGLILSGAIIKPGASLSPVKIMVARLLSLLLPKMGVDIIDASTLSRDKAVVAELQAEDLLFGEKRAALEAGVVRDQVRAFGRRRFAGLGALDEALDARLGIVGHDYVVEAVAVDVGDTEVVRVPVELVEFYAFEGKLGGRGLGGIRREGEAEKSQTRHES